MHALNLSYAQKEKLKTCTEAQAQPLEERQRKANEFKMKRMR